MTFPSPHPESFEINEGDVLCGRYRAERLIERSDTGMVVAAVDMLRGEGVAIKMIEPQIPEPEEVEMLAARLRREAHVLAQLTSPHVVRVFDVQKHGHVVCLVMELLQGANLGQVMRKREPLPIAEAVGIVLQACDALAEAHSIGVVHRDIKPQNIYLAQRPDGSTTVKVLDFGISKQQGGGMGLTATGAALGSPLYTAVEQFRDASRVDARADIWSLGLVLYFLLCRKNAFDADNPVALMLKIATSPPVPLRERRPDVPADLEAIILQCVEKDRERRFANVAALARALVPFGPPWGAAFLPAIEARISRRSLASLPPASVVPPPMVGVQTLQASAPDASRASSPFGSAGAPHVVPGVVPRSAAPLQSATTDHFAPSNSQSATGATPALVAPLGAIVSATGRSFGQMAPPPAVQGAPPQSTFETAAHGPPVLSQPANPAPRSGLSRQILIFVVALVAAAALAAISLAALSWVRGGG
ncbi:MAG: protein kinase [Polyangiaceae bacterium]